MLSFSAQGRQGEDVVALFLKKKGFLILEKNWRCHLGEVDIVAIEPRPFWQKVLFPKILPSSKIVFVEVKSQKRDGLAAERVDKRKQRKLKNLARLYLESKKLQGLSYRIDVCVVNLGRDKVKVRHIVSAVED